MSMVTEKGIMRTEVLFDSTKMERYLLRKVWDEKKPMVCLIMSNPSMTNVNAVTQDMTTGYVLNNLYKLGEYGGVDIVNLISTITTKIDTKEDIKLNDTNVAQILKSSEKCQKVIIGWGKIGENVKRIRHVQLQLLERLKPFEDKLYGIAATKDSNEFYHPLSPQIRSHWELQKFIIPKELEKESGKEETTQGNDTQKDGKQTA